MELLDFLSRIRYNRFKYYQLDLKFFCSKKEKHTGNSKEKTKDSTNS